MIYKKLSLLSFGKFKNKHLYFQEGINLILGNNETGKSTIHNFIEGMFYGFFTYGKKRKGYEELQHKYKPWNNDEYIGSLIYENDGNMYLIERNFSEINGRVKVSNYATGEDITEKFDFNDITRMYEPANHLNLSKVMFRNTVSIGQLNTQTENNLTEEVNNLMANMDTGLNDISIVSAIKKLRDAAEKIAGKKGEIRKIGEINQILEKVIQEKEETDEIIENDKKRKNRIEYLFEQLEKIKKHEMLLYLKDIQKYEDLQKQINENKKELENIKPVEGFDEERFEEILQLENEIHNYIDDLKLLKQRIEKIENDIKIMHTDMASDIQFDNVDQLRQDYIIYKQLKEGTYKKASSLIESISLVSFILFACLSIFFIFKNIPIFMILCILLAAGSLSYSIVLRIKSKNININDIYKKYGFINEQAFENYYSSFIEEYEKIETNKILIQAKIDEYTSLKQDITKLKSEYEEKNVEFLKTLENMGLSNNISYREVFRSNKQYNELKTKISHLELLKEETLSEAEYTLLKSKVSSYDTDDAELLEPNVSIEEKENILSELAHLQGISENAMQNIRSMTEIMAQIKELTQQRDILLVEYGALNLAADVIEDTAKEMHSQNSPILNKRVSEIIYGITNKYSNIKLTDELEINVESPESGFLVGINEMSEGTLEQLYFSLRIALADLFAPEVPLILDESFAMYDEQRLENIIRILYNISTKRQVLLFSCSKREKEVMDNMNINYNLITL
jgi:uncharacterized protein YhaN